MMNIVSARSLVAGSYRFGRFFEDLVATSRFFEDLVECDKNA
jgi:hypothetical protein